MKGNILLAVLGLGLVGAGACYVFDGPTFSPADRVEILNRFPGGRFVEGNAIYRLCLDGREHRLYPDGSRRYVGAECWR